MSDDRGRERPELLSHGSDSGPGRVHRAADGLRARLSPAGWSPRRRRGALVAGASTVVLGMVALAVVVLSRVDPLSPAAHRAACARAHDAPSARRIDDTVEVFGRCVWPPPPDGAADGFVEITRTTYSLPKVVRRASFTRVSVYSSACRSYTLGYDRGTGGEPLRLTDVSRRRIVSAFNGQPVDVIGRPAPPVEARGGGLVVMEGPRHQLTSVTCGRP